MTPINLIEAIASACPGDEIVYHVGFLAEDRARRGARGNPSPLAVDAGLCADIAWMCAAPETFILGDGREALDCGGLGIASAVQRKISSEHGYSYALRFRKAPGKADIGRLSGLLKARTTAKRKEHAFLAAA